KLLITTAASALIATAAWAQAPDSSTSTPSTPPAAAPGGTAPGGASFVATQRPDQFLASKFKGTDVLGSADKKIGDISDILFDKNGQIQAYVVSVGGFLGVGSKEVALPPSAFQAVADSGGTTGSGASSANDPNNMRLKVSMSQDELKNAQAFEVYKAPS